MSTHANLTYSTSNTDIVYTTPSGEQVVYDAGDLAWQLAATALVFLMTPGVGFFYSGLLRRKNALSMQLMAMSFFCIVTIQYFFWGYSLQFSNGNPFIGSLTNIGLRNTMAGPSYASPRIPDLLYAVFMLSFALVTPTIAFGAAAERGAIGGLLILVALWSSIVYNPIAHAVWQRNGFLYKFGALDFAGGGVVHTASGVAAVSYSLYVGKRHGFDADFDAEYRPSNVSNVILGTSLLIFGWIGFNAGSAYAANLAAVNAAFGTLVAGSAGGITWLLLDYRLQKKWSAIAICSGIVTGLVAVTPCAGYIGIPSALAVGVLGTAAANFSTRLKFRLNVDETLDIFAVHAVSGIVGTLLCGIFADRNIAALSGMIDIPGGWINHHWKQLGVQTVAVLYVAGYSGIVTYGLCFLVDHIPGTRIRVPEEDEIRGIDLTQIGEAALDLEGLMTVSEADSEASDPYARRASRKVVVETTARILLSERKKEDSDKQGDV